MTRIQERWRQHYESVPETLRALRDVETVLSVFNTNIDAVLELEEGTGGVNLIIE